MADPFATALGALFAGPAAVAARFLPAGAGPGMPLMVIRGRPDQLADLGDGQVVLGTNAIEIQRADLAVRPTTGDIVQLLNADGSDGDRLSIAGDARLDLEGLTWLCGAEEV